MTDEQVRYPGSLRGEQLRAEIGMYQDAMRQSASVLTALAKLDIDERLTTIQERDAMRVVEALRTALALARLTPELDEQVRMHFAARLREISRAKAAAEAEDEDEALTGVVIPAR